MNFKKCLKKFVAFTLKQMKIPLLVTRIIPVFRFFLATVQSNSGLGSFWEKIFDFKEFFRKMSCLVQNIVNTKFYIAIFQVKRNYLDLPFENFAPPDFQAGYRPA